MSQIPELQHLIEKHAVDPDSVAPCQLNKWIARSALQKAIRRGMVPQALSYATRLCEIDESYFWRSLAVIAVEDVGIGAPNSVFYTTYTMKFAQLREGLLLPLVKAMTEAPKSQACCEMSLAGEIAYVDLFHEMASKTDDDLISIMQADTHYRAYVAACVLRGWTPRKLTMPKRSLSDQSRGKVMRVIEQDLPGAWARAAWAAFETPVDSMSLAFYPVTRFMVQEGKMEMVDDDATPYANAHLPVIGGAIAPAYDVHTHTGKMALKAFYTSLTKKDQPWVSRLRPEQAVPVLGAAVFCLEGQNLNQRCVSPFLNELRQDQIISFISEHLDLEQMEPVGLEKFVLALCQVVEDNREVLNQKREWAVSIER